LFLLLTSLLCPSRPVCLFSSPSLAYCS
jgi:hypothetical protein